LRGLGFEQAISFDIPMAVGLLQVISLYAGDLLGLAKIKKSLAHQNTQGHSMTDFTGTKS
jgi:hypothetical protein